MNTLVNIKRLAYTLFAALLLTAAAAAQQTAERPEGVAIQTTAFTYQGKLTDSTMAANGTYDFQIVLFRQSVGGTAIGTETIPNVTVTNGIFTVELDFGFSAFPNEVRYLEIRVKRPSDANYTTLTPRQEITSAPFAIRSKVATTADNATNATTANNALAVGGTAAANIIKEGDARLSDARTPTAGSADYIQNTATQQTGTANFSINGDGAAGGTLTGNVVNARTQFNINGTRMLFASVSNVAVGLFANGDGTSFSGSNNSFFGRYSGFNNTGSNNTFLGASTGEQNTGGNNSFVGIGAGFFNTDGGSNSFFGASAGRNNLTGGNNTAIGSGADVGNNNLTYATAIGSGAIVRTSNTVVLGRENGNDKVRIFGLGASGSTSLCRNSDNEISTCTAGNRAESNKADKAELDQLREQVRQQQFVINGLKKIVCANNPNAEVCQ